MTKEARVGLPTGPVNGIREHQTVRSIQVHSMVVSKMKHQAIWMVEMRRERPMKRSFLEV
jgi:hypothetical protein